MKKVRKQGNVEEKLENSAMQGRLMLQQLAIGIHNASNAILT